MAFIIGKVPISISRGQASSFKEDLEERLRKERMPFHQITVINRQHNTIISIFGVGETDIGRTANELDVFINAKFGRDSPRTIETTRGRTEGD